MRYSTRECWCTLTIASTQMSGLICARAWSVKKEGNAARAVERESGEYVESAESVGHQRELLVGRDEADIPVLCWAWVRKRERERT